MVQCDNDGDASIMNVALIEATGDSIEVNTIFLLIPLCMVVDFTVAGKRCRFPDNAGSYTIAQISTIHFFTTSKSFYHVKMIREALSDRHRG